MTAILALALSVAALAGILRAHPGCARIERLLHGAAGEPAVTAGVAAAGTACATLSGPALAIAVVARTAATRAERAGPLRDIRSYDLRSCASL